MYSILDYGDMIADRGRTEAYARALRAAITPDSAVLDIGAGPGILSFLACQAGARRVYAVEPAAVIEVAKELAAANGFTDRVHFIQAMSTSIDLPERVDVVVSDVHGVLPLFEGSVVSILDARNRFLKPGGVIIPMRKTVFVSLVKTGGPRLGVVVPWQECYGLETAPALRRAVNTSRKVRLSAGDVVAAPRAWCTLDYRSLTETRASGRVSWTLTAMQADVIHVMDNGRVTESGSHGELLRHDGAYAQSWRMQMRAEQSAQAR